MAQGLCCNSHSHSCTPTHTHTHLHQEEKFTCRSTTCAPDAIMKMKFLDVMKALTPRLTHQGIPVGRDIRASAWLGVAVAVVANCLYQELWARRRRKRDDSDFQSQAQWISLSMCHAQRNGSGYTECRTPCTCGSCLFSRSRQ